MKHVLFAQLPRPRFSFSEAASNIPLAAGFLCSALNSAEMREGTWEILDSAIGDVFADEALAQEIVNRQPAVLALTLYVWNVQRSLFLASNVKRQIPDTKVLIGGPEVTPDNLWLLNHPAVDAGVFGEGESRIVSIVRRLMNDPSRADTPGSFFKTDRGLHVSEQLPEPWVLSATPYPYLDKTIEPTVDGSLFLETMRGCPFRCRYCYYYKTSAGVRLHPDDSLERILDHVYSDESTVREIYLMDPTFNARPGFRKLLTGMARRRREKDLKIHTELRADLLSSEDVRLLRDAGLVSAEVGLQSIHPHVLRKAGRSCSIDQVARGVALLKGEGIEVTTGIIAGLPGDTPGGFVSTLQWIEKTQAYSVVHPFVLSVLPGTDFKSRAVHLGLEYDPRPPYYVQSTPTFPHGEFRNVLEECEATFGMELDYVPPPSLVDQGPGMREHPEDSRYVSKWIVDPARGDRWRPIIASVVARATDPFVFWFRGSSANECKDGIEEILSRFQFKNPHAFVSVVWEFSDPPAISVLESALAFVSQDEVYLGRSFAPLYEPGEIRPIHFILIVPDPGSQRARDALNSRYGAFARLAWDLPTKRFGDLPRISPPVLISLSHEQLGNRRDELFTELLEFYDDNRTEVLFRDHALQQAWNRQTRDMDPSHIPSERIVLTR